MNMSSPVLQRIFEDQQLLMDDISYRCLYKQEPIEREGLLFPEDKIRRYLNLPHGEPEIVTGQCDTKGKGTDYFVLPVLQNTEKITTAWIVFAITRQIMRFSMKMQQMF